MIEISRQKGAPFNNIIRLVLILYWDIFNRWQVGGNNKTSENSPRDPKLTESDLDFLFLNLLMPFLCFLYLSSFFEVTSLEAAIFIGMVKLNEPRLCNDLKKVY